MALSLIIAQNGQEIIMELFKEIKEVKETKKSCRQQPPTDNRLLKLLLSCEGVTGSPEEIREIEKLIAETKNK
jgi:uncharacterized protein YneF (UPF0154 family)